MLTFDEYQALASRTRNTKLSHEDSVASMGLGLSGEAGECSELVKKYLFHGHPLDRTELAKELGDVLWYLAGLAGDCNLLLSEVAGMNIKKLKARYPEGFTEQASLERKEE